MTGKISSRTCYTKLNFDFSYVRFFSLRRDPYMKPTFVLNLTQHIRSLSIVINSVLADNDILYKNEHPPYGRPAVKRRL